MPTPASDRFVSLAEFHSHNPWCQARRGHTLTPERCTCGARVLSVRNATAEELEPWLKLRRALQGGAIL